MKRSKGQGEQLRSRWKTAEGARLLEKVTTLLLRDGTTRTELLEITSSFREAGEIPDYVDLRGLQFNGEIYGLDVERIDMSYAHSLQGENADPFILLKKCNVSSSRFNQIATKLSISGCEIHGSELVGANLRRNIFSSSGVTACRFDEAKLMGSDFVGCDLTDCSFLDADLTNATLVRAKCVNTDFRGAKLRGALFDDADLATNTKFDDAALASAASDEAATMLEIAKVARQLVNSRYAEYAHLRPALDHLIAGLDSGDGIDLFERVNDGLPASQRDDLAYLLERAAREI